MNGTIQDVQHGAADKAQKWPIAASAISILTGCIASICRLGPFAKLCEELGIP